MITELGDLRRLVARGEPWGSDVEEAFASMKPAEVAEILRKLGLRTKLYNAKFGPRTPDLLEVIRLAQAGRRREVPRPIDMLVELRRQFFRLISGWKEENRRRMRHIYDFHLIPGPVRARAGRFFAMTFLPGRHRLVFDEGVEYFDASQLVTVTLSCRRHSLPSGRVIDMFDLRLMGTHVDPESSVVTYGGATRCRLARHFNFTPFPGAAKLILDSHNVAVFEAGLACFEHLEDAVVGGAAAQAAPEFPRIYLGFVGDPDWDFERTKVLEESAYRYVDRAIRTGSPCPFLDKLRFPRVTSWEEIEARLSPEEVDFLIKEVWVGQEKLLPDGLKIHPLDLFSSYGQQPVKKALRVLCEFAEHFKGRKVLLPDGSLASDSCQARCQVVKLPNRASLTGNVRGVEYDFSSVPPGMEQFFAHA